MATPIHKQRFQATVAIFFIVWGFTLGYRYNAAIDAIIMWILSYFIYVGKE